MQMRIRGRLLDGREGMYRKITKPGMRERDVVRV